MLRAYLASLAVAAGQSAKRVKDDYLHLTLCVVAETICRDRSIVARVVSALHDRALFSCPFQLGILEGSERGALVRAGKQQDELQDFYAFLRLCLRQEGIFPLHRKSGLHPHVTLGRDSCSCVPLMLPRQWIPDELLLIESEVGNGVHHVLARWSLLPPRQGGFGFEDAPRFAA